MNVEVAKARIGDVPAVVALVGRYARRGEVLPRPPENVYETLREWVVAKQDGELIGCGSLVILWADLAEIRSLVVVPEVQGVGVGRQIVCGLLAEAGRLEVPHVFALTRKPGFFAKLGFDRVARESLPRKIWKDCMHCTKFTGCDEVAVIRAVSSTAASMMGRAMEEASTSASGDNSSPTYLMLPDQPAVRR